MPRNRRRDRGASAHRPPAQPSGPTLAKRAIAQPREWRWRTFPVYFTCATTLLVSSILVQVLGYWPLFLIGVLLFAGALSHLVSMYLIAPRMRPPRGR